MEDEQTYNFCIRCGTKVEDFTWVKHFSNAYFIGCPRCHSPKDSHHSAPLKQIINIGGSGQMRTNMKKILTPKVLIR